MDDDEEAYLLLVLSDSNLPTGSFVASSGLESSITHGFTTSSLDSTVAFVRDSLHTYARSAVPFVSDAHECVQALREGEECEEERDIKPTLDYVLRLDELYNTMTLNQVTRRASKSQGVALLTLFSKGFSDPLSNVNNGVNGSTPSSLYRITALVSELKLLVRREETEGHLPICWGVLTAALGLSLERSQYLHLFLHARSLLSAAVRLNMLGPYSAQQVLLHFVKPLVDMEAKGSINIRTGLSLGKQEDGDANVRPLEEGPANTWPLGEILAARHDLLHSRIFNS